MKHIFLILAGISSVSMFIGLTMEIKNIIRSFFKEE